MKVTKFQKQVFDALLKIPLGRVTTYKNLARYIGNKSPRAVGQALRCNPFSPEIPCHRVIKSDLSIGGFAGSLTGKKILRKIMLLKKEGVLFSSGRLLDATLLFDFPRNHRQID